MHGKPGMPEQPEQIMLCERDNVQNNIIPLIMKFHSGNFMIHSIQSFLAVTLQHQ